MIYTSLAKCYQARRVLSSGDLFMALSLQNSKKYEISVMIARKYPRLRLSPLYNG